jgi:hypothetical protein
MTNPTYTERTAILDLPRVKGIVLDRINNRSLHWTAIDTEMGIFAFEIAQYKDRFDLRIRNVSGSVKSVRRRDLPSAVACCLVSARRRGIAPIVWLLTEPEPQQEAAP